MRTTLSLSVLYFERSRTYSDEKVSFPSNVSTPSTYAFANPLVHVVFTGAKVIFSLSVSVGTTHSNFSSYTATCGGPVNDIVSLVPSSIATLGVYA